MELHIAGICHIGNLRDNNEDNILINGSYRTDPGQKIKALEDSVCGSWSVCAVFDGMGGESYGETASLKAAESFSSWEPSLDRRDIEDIFLKANDDIYDNIPKLRGQRSGTTAAVFISDGEKAAVCNIGDSRIYRYRSGYLEQLSRDHTSSQQLMDMGIEKTGHATAAKYKGSLTQYLGIPRDEFQIEPFIYQDAELRHDDTYIICSDGLTDMLSDEELEAVLEKHTGQDTRVTAAAVVKAALDNGGRDNVSAVIIRVL